MLQSLQFKKPGSIQPCQGTWRISDELRNRSQLTIAKLLEEEKLSNPAVFQRTMALIFSGPKGLDFAFSKDRSRTSQGQSAHKGDARDSGDSVQMH